MSMQFEAPSPFSNPMNSQSEKANIDPGSPFNCGINYAISVATDLGLYSVAISLVEKTQHAFEQDFDFRLCVIQLNLAMGQPQEALSYADSKMSDSEKSKELFKIIHAGVLMNLDRFAEAHDVLATVTGADDPEYAFRAQELNKICTKIEQLRK